MQSVEERKEAGKAKAPTAPRRAPAAMPNRVEQVTTDAPSEVEAPSEAIAETMRLKGDGFRRVPFGQAKLRLQLSKRPGYHRHWFNDTPGRLDAARLAGYTHIKDPVSRKPIKAIVGVKAGGGALEAFAMEVPVDWYNADMAEGQRTVDEIEAAIKGGAIGSGERGQEKGTEMDTRYVPAGGIKIE